MVRTCVEYAYRRVGIIWPFPLTDPKARAIQLFAGPTSKLICGGQQVRHSQNGRQLSARKVHDADFRQLVDHGTFDPIFVDHATPCGATFPVAQGCTIEPEGRNP